MKILTPYFGELDTKDAVYNGEYYKWRIPHKLCTEVIIVWYPENGLILQYDNEPNKLIPIMYRRKSDEPKKLSQ
jgi:hypothetical protein